MKPHVHERRTLYGVEIAEIARQLRISYQAVAQWERVPHTRVLEVSRITGVPPHEIRPDVYPSPETMSAA